jgi:hypothetical protein
MVYVGGDDESRQMQAQAILTSLGDRATDLGGASWRVFEFDTSTQEEARVALGLLLKEIDPGWQSVFAVAEE